MGEIADDLIDRMFDDDEGMYYPHRNNYYQNSSPRPYNTKIKPKPKSDPKDRSTWKTRDYPEKTFDMGFFPTIPPKAPKPEPVVETPVPDVWDINTGDAPF